MTGAPNSEKKPRPGETLAEARAAEVRTLVLQAIKNSDSNYPRIEVGVAGRDECIVGVYLGEDGKCIHVMTSSNGGPAEKIIIYYHVINSFSIVHVAPALVNKQVTP